MGMIWLVLLFAVLAAVAVVVYRQTRAKGPFGLDLGRKNCPRCGNPLPVLRKPASQDETLYGGWTCEKCGAKVDKYGRLRAPV